MGSFCNTVFQIAINLSTRYNVILAFIVLQKLPIILVRYVANPWSVLFVIKLLMIYIPTNICSRDGIHNPGTKFPNTFPIATSRAEIVGYNEILFLDGSRFVDETFLKFKNRQLYICYIFT